MKRKSTSKAALAARQEKLAALKARLDEYEAGLEPAERAAILMKFSGYSDRNSLLIAMQRPEATECHGYNEWQSLGRQVRKGESGIQVLAPAGSRTEKVETESGEDGEKVRQFFKIAYTFDISQTDPIEAEQPAKVSAYASVDPIVLVETGTPATPELDDETCGACQKPLNDGCDCCPECEEHHDDCTCPTCPGCQLCWHCYTHDSSSAGCAVEVAAA